MRNTIFSGHASHSPSSSLLLFLTATCTLNPLHISLPHKPNQTTTAIPPSSSALSSSCSVALNQSKMSGGVGPCNDISLPKEEEEVIEPQQLTSSDSSSSSKPQKPIQKTQTKGVVGGGGGGNLLSFRQLNALAIMIVISASGMVSIEDFSFVFLSFFYVFFLSKVAFPPHQTSSSTEPPIFGEKNRILGLYVSIGALIGLFLPILYIFHGIIEGDKQGIKAASPHVFLLSGQIFMEGLTFSSNRFSLPIRAFVPVFYNSMRIMTIMEWLKNEIGKVDQVSSGSEMRLFVGRGLAIANMGFWCFNLFAFLLPVYLPRAFKRYYYGYKEKV